MNSLAGTLVNQLKQMQLEQYNLDYFQEKESINTLMNLNGVLERLAGLLKEEGRDSRTELRKRILHISEDLCWIIRLYLISFVMLEFGDAELMERFEEEITASPEIPTFAKYY